MPAGCQSCFGTDELSNQTALQQATPHVNRGAVSNVLHCSMTVFRSPDVYVLSVDLPWNLERSFIRKDDSPWEFIVFVQFLIKDGPCKSLCATHTSYHLEELHGTPATCNTQMQAFSRRSMHCQMGHLQLTHCNSCQLGVHSDISCSAHWQQRFTVFQGKSCS